MDTLLEAAKEGVSERRTLFLLYWTQDHFGYKPKDICRTVPSLTEEETYVHQRLSAFVQSFLRKIKTGKRGDPLMNADGTPVTEPCFINTHELVMSQDLDDFLCSCILLCFPIILFVYYLPCLTSLPCFLCFAGKMKDLRALMNEANKKVAAKKRHKNAQSADLLTAGSDPGSTSGPVVDLEGENCPKEKV